MIVIQPLHPRMNLDGRHAGLTIMIGQTDPIDSSLMYLGVSSENLGDFGRGDVFAFPPEGIAEAG
jgi:hypothetical protein